MIPALELANTRSTQPDKFLWNTQRYRRATTQYHPEFLDVGASEREENDGSGCTLDLADLVATLDVEVTMETQLLCFKIECDVDPNSGLPTPQYQHKDLHMSGIGCVCSPLKGDGRGCKHPHYPIHRDIHLNREKNVHDLPAGYFWKMRG